MTSEVGQEEESKHIESDDVEHVHYLGWLELISTHDKKRVVDYY